MILIITLYVSGLKEVGRVIFLLEAICFFSRNYGQLLPASETLLLM
jgi:hypothetical protein